MDEEKEVEASSDEELDEDTWKEEWLCNPMLEEEEE